MVSHGYGKRNRFVRKEKDLQKRREEKAKKEALALTKKEEKKFKSFVKINKKPSIKEGLIF